MQAISLKLDENMLKNIDNALKDNNYSTRTEFIRDAIRKRLEDMNKEDLIQEFLKFRGKAKKKTTREENKKTAESVLLQIAKERGWEN